MKATDYFFPEKKAGGFTRVDGTINFFSRVNALMDDEMIVLDYGAGRGRLAADDPVDFRRNLLSLKGKCKRLIGVDIDDEILKNPSLDEAHIIEIGLPIPLPDESVDLIVSDHVFEHVADPEFVSGELNRVLKPGGWICARTPNRWGHIGIGTNIIPNKLHVSILKYLQPNRKSIDVFPTEYRLNTKKQLKAYFPEKNFEHCTYGYNAEPAYFSDSKIMWAVVLFLFRLLPESWFATWMIFIMKK